jgi:hypothetical protein
LLRVADLVAALRVLVDPFAEPEMSDDREPRRRARERPPREVAANESVLLEAVFGPE